MPLDSAHSILKPHGVMTITGADGNVTQHDTLRCVHCQKVWVVKPGSGIRRGFCQKCMGPVCGAEACITGCMNWEKRLDLYEAGKLTTL